MQTGQVDSIGQEELNYFTELALHETERWIQVSKHAHTHEYTYIDTHAYTHEYTIDIKTDFLYIDGLYTHADNVHLKYTHIHT